MHTTAEAATGKGDSLDVYMKSVKDKLDKGTVHEMKLQINKLKKVCSLHKLTYLCFEDNIFNKHSRICVRILGIPQRVITLAL